MKYYVFRYWNKYAERAFDVTFSATDLYDAVNQFKEWLGEDAEDKVVISMKVHNPN